MRFDPANEVRLLAKNFLLGSGLKTLLNLLRWLTGGRKKGQAFLTILDYRFGLFLGILGASMSTLTHALRAYRQKDDAYNPIVAGALSSFTLKLAGEDVRAPLALYSLVRSAEAVLRVCNNKGFFPSWVSNFNHWDVVLMCLTAREVLYGYVFQTHTVDPTYLAFLNKHGHVDRRVVHVIGRWYDGTPHDPNMLNAIVKDFKIDTSALRHPSGCWDGCKIIHPHVSCGRFLVDFFLGGLKRALEVYLPIHGLYALLLLAKGRRTPAAALHTLRRFAENLAMSTTFLSMYCTLAWLMPCFLMRVFHWPSHNIVYHLLGLAGCAAWLDQKSRRLELALYCAPRALEVFWRRNIGAGLRHGDFFMFLLAMMGINYCHVRHRDALKGTLKTFLDFMFI
jgi:hypothetical protein